MNTLLSRKTSLPMARRRPATLGLPSGWFVVATSAELARERVLNTRFMSEDLVLYRTASGEARATAAYCPHLGAHLGHCGAVDGEALRCDFHHFAFDARGACVRTGDGARPPPAARLAVHHVREHQGLILVYHDPTGAPPTWEVPEIDLTGWSKLVVQKFSLRGHPQETTENGVDISHFSAVHGFREVRVLRDMCAFGPCLNARYGIRRAFGPLARLGVDFDMEFEVNVHGLGYSRVEVDLKPYGIRSQLFVFATPTEAGFIDLRLGVSVEEPILGPFAALLPRRRIAEAIARCIAVLYAHDVQRDFRIWEHKRYLSRPALSAREGSLGLYRKWARQFYAEGSVEG